MKHLIKVLLLCLLTLPATAQTDVQLSIIDGKTNQPVLQLSAAQSQSSADGIRVEKQSRAAQNAAPQRWDYKITNNSTGDRWLYLNWETPWKGTGDINSLHYWRGKGEPVTGKYLNENPTADISMNTSMLQALYDDKKGIALALPPDQILSQFHQTLVLRDQKYFLQLQIPLVLSGGQSDTFPVELYQFVPRYGFLDALQKYFLAHPQDFTARTDIDSRAAGVSGARPWIDIAGTRYTDILIAKEKVRRFQSDWEWFYAPFRRTGDIYTHDKWWDYKPARPFNDFRTKPSAEAFRQFRHDLIDNVNATGAIPAFYVPSFLYAEEQLAQQEYPEAIIRKPDGSIWRHYTRAWVTGNDNEIALYPWGNKFAEQSMADAKQLVAENDIPAFAYDIMAGGFRFRGKGMKESPRRSFDKDGEYVDNAVAVAKMQDFTRSLVNNGKKVGLVGNATNDSRPFLVARSDTLMSEQPAYYYPEELVALRYAAGHKQITTWVAWLIPSLLEADQMTSEELRSAYKAAAEYTRLIAYRYGTYPSVRWIEGVPEIAKMLPLLKETLTKGWQAVPAVRGAQASLPDFLWTARYGNDLDSSITLGNAAKTPWSGTVVIDNDYLGNTNYLFLEQNAGKVLSQHVQGRTTILQVEIPARDTLILRAVAAVPVSALGDAAVSWNDDGAAGKLTVKSTFKPTTVASPRAGWKLQNNAGDQWNFDSLYFHSPVIDLQNFPYFSEKETAQIVLSSNATAEEQWAAQQLQDYFKFWGEFGAVPKRDIILPITQNVNSANPTIRIDGKTIGIIRNGNTLTIGAKDVRENTRQLMAALDQKYFYVGTITAAGKDKESLQKAGLAGKVLE